MIISKVIEVKFNVLTSGAFMRIMCCWNAETKQWRCFQAADGRGTLQRFLSCSDINNSTWAWLLTRAGNEPYIEDLRNNTRAFSVVVKLQILRRFVASSIDSWLLTLRSPVEHRMDFIGLRSSDPLNMNPPSILRKRSKFFINSKWMRFYEIIKWKCFHK